MNSQTEPHVISFPQKDNDPVEQKIPHDPLAPTIFHEAWWLDIATGGNYKYVEVQDKGEVVGRLPYFPKKRFGLRYNIMPELTHFVGPGVIEGDGSDTTRFLRKSTIIRELLKQLPDYSIHKYKCHRDITDAIAFQQSKFMVNVQFTHEIAPATEEVLWKNLRVEKRKKIKQAQKLHTISHMTDPDEFWHFYEENLGKRGMKSVYKYGSCREIIKQTLERDRGRIYTARDANNNLTTAIFCIWDATTSYYFMCARTPEAHNGAMSLLVWEAMKDISARGLIFDFDGINSSSSVLFFTEFGGTISPRYIVTRSTLAGGIALATKEYFRENRYFF